jgi:hypothetical protein
VIKRLKMDSKCATPVMIVKATQSPKPLNPFISKIQSHEPSKIAFGLIILEINESVSVLVARESPLQSTTFMQVISNQSEREDLLRWKI